MEHQRSVAFIFAVAAAGAGHLVFSAANEMNERMALGYPSTGLIAAAVVVGVVTFLFAMRREAWSTFVDSVVGELIQVSWPTREETTRNTVVVVVSTLVFATILFVFGEIAEQVTRTFLI